MAVIKVNDLIPQGVFKYVPYTPELEDHSVCGRPIEFYTDEWKRKKVVLFSVPGAFTPTCHVNHLPPYLDKHEEFKKKGVDVIAVLAANDPFVMSGWARFEGLKDKILALSDTDAQWSTSLGLSQNLEHVGFGTRTKRYAMIIDNLFITYLGVEEGPGVTVSGADAVLEHL
ncbi:hypothetical protein APHAL10511_000512 [Amanita phalloides]|nr:hypothetical protein APHAL10511_000512 [Amanita phalloides]